MNDIIIRRTDETPLGLADVINWIDSADVAALPAFSDEAVQFCDALSQHLKRAIDVRRYPEVGALAFWLRRAAVTRLRAEIMAKIPADVVRVPRGLAFHLPPTNVDTVFLYSWALSFLVGNRNLIRLSRRHDGVAAELSAALAEALAQSPSPLVRGNTLMISYDHDDAITAALSAKADLRVVWGGDDSVNHIRGLPLGPLAVDVAFPSRTSLATLSASAVLALDEAGRLALARRFYNDSYVFDQMACSSPRRVVWVGALKDSRRASAEFFAALASVAGDKGYDVATATVLRKMTLAAGALVDGKADHLVPYGNSVTVATMNQAADQLDDFCGGGLFEESHVESPADLVHVIARQDQTLTYFGLTDADLRALAVAAGPRCVDRIVPVGDALSFNRYWDGMDLVQAFSRSVHLPAATGATF